MAEEEIKKLTNNKTVWYVAGAVVAVLGYLWWKHRQASAASNAVTNAGIPLNEPSGAMGNTTSFAQLPTSNPISTFTDWANSVQTWASKTLGKDAADVQNALQAYSNGECLTSSQYSVIDQALAQFGAPPNAPFNGVVMCPQVGGTPTTSPTSQVQTSSSAAPWFLGQQVQPSGEKIVDVVQDPHTGGWYGVTNFGGVYTSGGAAISSVDGGSYLGYLQTIQNNPALVKANIPNGPGSGLGDFSQGKIVVTGPGHYAIQDNTGHWYNF